MDLVFGSEISFVNGFSIKPTRSFVVNTNAPLYSSGFDGVPSGGIATFPHSSNYADRIFVWRAVGQKLFIEERSLIFAIEHGSLCIDFTRSTIIPGTSITIFEEGVLCIIVPTASAIYRFYARLHVKGRDTFSILARLKEDEEFRRFQSMHPLSTPGRPVRASVTHHKTRNTIAYCTAEGQLVVISMGSYTDPVDKHEEFTIGEVGLLGKLLGGSDKRVSDAVVMRNLRPAPTVSKERKSTVQADIVFAVTRDGWVQAWNVETRKQLQSTVDLNEFCANERGEKRESDEFELEETPSIADSTETVYTIKAYHFDVDILIIVGCDVLLNGKSIGTRIHILKMAEDQLEHLKVYETSMSPEERLIDLELIQTFFPVNDPTVSEETQTVEEFNSLTAAQFSLTALFKSSSAKKNYAMKRVSFAIDWKKGQTSTLFDWHNVKQFSTPATTRGDPTVARDQEGTAPERPYNLSSDSTIETLVDVVLDTDIYSFDIVFRAVQIVSDNFRGSSALVHHNNWKELSKLIDVYITSVEFNRKFQQKTDRSIRLRLNGQQETQSTAVKDFWWALLRACEELDFAARGTIALAPMQLSSDLKIMAVIHKDRFTILGDNNTEFLDIISQESIPKQGKEVEDKYRKVPNKQFVDLIEQASEFADRRVYLMNRERARIMSAKNGIQIVDDEGAENAYDYEADGRFITIKTALEAPIVSLTQAFVNSSTFDNSKPYGDPRHQIFGGPFTQSLVSANVRVTVESRVHFALTLQALLNAITEKKLRAGAASFGDVEALSCELREIIRVYRELNEKLDLKIFKNGAKMSIGTWLVSDDEGLRSLKCEGGFGPNGYEEIRDSDFNWFVGVTTEAAVRALLSTSEVLTLPRRLAMHKQYKVLLTILNSYISETRALKPAITFYRGIAYSGTEHPVKALNAFQSCLEPFSQGNMALRKAIYYLLPKRFTVPKGKNPLEELGPSEYFLTVVRFLQDHGHSQEVCSVAMKAIENLPIDNPSVQVISNTLFNHLSKQHEWFQALKLILRTTLRAETRRASICELLTMMLAVGEWEAIATMKFGVHEQIVEDFLREAAIRQSPNEKKHHFELLFSFYIARKDFRKAACSMYEYARHIETSPQMTPELLRRRRDCLAVVLNLQSVLSMEPEGDRPTYDDWTDTNLVFPKPGEDDDDEEGEEMQSESPAQGGVSAPARRPMQILSESTPSSQSSPNISSQSASSSAKSVDMSALKAQQMAVATSNDEEMETDENKPIETKPLVPLSKRRKLLVLSEKDIRDEWVLCSARVGLIGSDQFSGVPPTDPTELFSMLVDTFHFDEAFDVARQFSLDSRKLYFTLTREAIMIDALREDLHIEIAATQQAGWVRTNRRHCLAVAAAEDHWAVVRGLIDAARFEWPGDSRPLRGAAEAFLSFKLSMPFWLHSVFESHDASDYIRCLVDYESYFLALQVLGDVVEKETANASKPYAKTWIPYGIVDELMLRSADFVRKMSVRNPEDQVLATDVASLRKSVDQKMVSYFRKVADLENAQKMSMRFFDK